MNSPEIKSELNKDVEYVNSKKLSCAGVEGPLGHPKYTLIWEMITRSFVRIVVNYLYLNK